MEDVKVFLGDFQDEKVALMKQLEATSYLSYHWSSFVLLNHLS